MAKKKPKPKPDVKRSWVLGPKGVVCFPDSAGDCQVIGLWETSVLTEFHDAELAKATREINTILSSIEEANTDPDRTLSLISVRNRHFLVWANCDGITPDDDEAKIVKAFKLRAR